MQRYNYSSYVKIFATGLSNSNMTEITKKLFEPIISQEFVLNKKGQPYNINSREASDWYNQKRDIPKNIKKAVEKPQIYCHIGEYFQTNIIEKYINPLKESTMYENMLLLIKQSNLAQEEKLEFEKIYSEHDYGNFLGRAFLYSLVQDNRRQKDECSLIYMDDDLKTLERIIHKYPKPVPIQPPAILANSELKYVNELYSVYQEKTGTIFSSPEDLLPFKKWRLHFERQRKDYYLAETVCRGLRDTMCQNEAEKFDYVKDEIYDGVINTAEKDYACGFDRLTAVMEHATSVSLSHNIQMMILNWIGPGEKKGICHMLVNDERLSWLGDV